MFRTAVKVTDVGLKLHHAKGGPQFFHVFSSCWVKMRLNTERKLPRLPASALKVSVGGWAGILPFIKSLPNEAELGCDNVLWYKSKLKHFIK
jgi:hypothetical protein